MCADTDFIEKKENIVIYCVFIKRPQYFIENNEILRLIYFRTDYQILSKRPLAPQGSTSPFEETGRPISLAVTLPSNF